MKLDLFKVTVTSENRVRLVCLLALCAAGSCFFSRASARMGLRAAAQHENDYSGRGRPRSRTFSPSSWPRARCRILPAWPQQGSFRRLTTSIPPQSPVAWSNLITGMNAGGHGIFDFIHRDPKNFQLYFSTSKVEGPTHSFQIGTLGDSAGQRLGRAVAPRQGFLGDSGRKSRAQFRLPHPGKFPSDRRQGEDALRHGHARPARHLRHVHFLHRRSDRGRGRGRRAEKLCRWK